MNIPAQKNIPPMPKRNENEYTTYQLYLMLLGYITEQTNDDSIKDILLELYKRSENII